MQYDGLLSEQTDEQRMAAYLHTHILILVMLPITHWRIFFSRI